MTEIRAQLLSTFTSSNDSTLIIILQQKDQLESIVLGEFISRSLNNSSDAVKTLRKLGTSINPNTETCAWSSGTVLREDGELQKFVIAILPEIYSRHNSPARSHTISAMINASKGTGNLTILITPTEVTKPYVFAQACAVGRQFPLFSMKSKVSAPIKVDIVIDVPSPSIEDEQLISDINFAISNIRTAQRLVDTPPNILHTDAYVEECKLIAAQLKCNIEVIQGFELETRGFGGLWGVGKASEHLPALVIFSYVPTGKENDKSICLVGKGIVYDTGGLSIKTPTTSMAGMKTDMGGSAAVLGSFATAVSSGNLTHPLYALLCIAENSVSALATRPDDIHVMLSGKTVEVNNTDAEGRLVLADGCFYASKYLNPSHIVDIATLTGAQLIATGKNHSAIYCSDEELENTAVICGKISGDLAFPIPYCPEFYKNEFRSAVADMKNSVADRGNAQSSCAGQFIGNHLEDYLKIGGKWLHVDMAGPCNVSERATGYGVGLLFQLVKQLQN
eukprot:gene11559-15479_t